MKKITIFTTNTCAYCKMVKQFLTLKGQNFNVVNLDDNPEEAARAQKISGALTVPITLFEDGEDQKVVVGYNPGSLMAAIA